MVSNPTLSWGEAMQIVGSHLGLIPNYSEVHDSFYFAHACAHARTTHTHVDPPPPHGLPPPLGGLHPLSVWGAVMS